MSPEPFVSRTKALPAIKEAMRAWGLECCCDYISSLTTNQNTDQKWSLSLS